MYVAIMHGPALKQAGLTGSWILPLCTLERASGSAPRGNVAMVMMKACLSALAWVQSARERWLYRPTADQQTLRCVDTLV